MKRVKMYLIFLKINGKCIQMSYSVKMHLLHHSEPRVSEVIF